MDFAEGWTPEPRRDRAVQTLARPRFALWSSASISLPHPSRAQGLTPPRGGRAHPAGLAAPNRGHLRDPGQGQGCAGQWRWLPRWPIGDPAPPSSGTAGALQVQGVVQVLDVSSNKSNANRSIQTNGHEEAGQRWDPTPLSQLQAEERAQAGSSLHGAWARGAQGRGYGSRRCRLGSRCRDSPADHALPPTRPNPGGEV